MTVALSHHGSRLRSVCDSLSTYPSRNYQVHMSVCKGRSRTAETYVYIAAKSQATSCTDSSRCRDRQAPAGTLDTRRGATQKLPDKWLNHRVLVTAQPTSHRVQHEDSRTAVWECTVSSGIEGYRSGERVPVYWQRRLPGASGSLCPTGRVGATASL